MAKETDCLSDREAAVTPMMPSSRRESATACRSRESWMSASAGTVRAIPQSPASGIATVCEPGVTSQVRPVREVVCA